MYIELLLHLHIDFLTNTTVVTNFCICADYHPYCYPNYWLLVVAGDCVAYIFIVTSNSWPYLIIYYLHTLVYV